MGTEGVIVAGWVCMTVAGIFLAIQSGVNLTLGSYIGKSLAAVVSFGTGLLVLLVYFVIDTQAFGTALPNKSGASGAPWWAWIGGPLGAFYVASIILFAPHLGAANSLSVFVAAQLTTALVLDSQGWVGYKKRAFHWARALGLAFLIVGVVLVAKFEGKSDSTASPPAASSSGQPSTLKSTTSEGAASSIEVSPTGSSASRGNGLRESGTSVVELQGLNP